MRHLPKPLMLFCLGLPHISTEIKAPHQTRRYTKNHDSIVNNTGFFIKSTSEADLFIETKSAPKPAEPTKKAESNKPTAVVVSSSPKLSPTQDPDISAAPHSLMEAWKKNLQKKLEQAIVDRQQAREKEAQKIAVNDPDNVIPKPTIAQTKENSGVTLSKQFPWLIRKEQEAPNEETLVTKQSDKTAPAEQGDQNKEALAIEQGDQNKETVAMEQVDQNKETVAMEQVDQNKETVAMEQVDQNKETVAAKQVDQNKETVAAKQVDSFSNEDEKNIMPNGYEPIPLQSVFSTFQLPKDKDISHSKASRNVKSLIKTFQNIWSDTLSWISSTFTRKTRLQSPIKSNEQNNSKNINLNDKKKVYHNHQKAIPLQSVFDTFHLPVEMKETASKSTEKKPVDTNKSQATSSHISWLKKAEQSLKNFFAPNEPSEVSQGDPQDRTNQNIISDNKQVPLENNDEDVGANATGQENAANDEQKQTTTSNSIRIWLKKAEQNLRNVFSPRNPSEANQKKENNPDQTIASENLDDNKTASPSKVLAQPDETPTSQGAASEKSYITSKASNASEKSKKQAPSATNSKSNPWTDSFKSIWKNAFSSFSGPQQKKHRPSYPIGSVANVEAKEKNSFTSPGQYQINNINTEELETLEHGDSISTQEHRIQLTLKEPVLLSLDQYTALSIKKVIDINELLLSKGRVRIQLHENAGLWTVRGRDLGLSLLPMSDIIVDMTGALITRIFVIQGGCTCLPQSSESPIVLTTGEHLSLGLSDFQRSKPSTETWTFLKQHLSLKKVDGAE